MMLAKVKEQGLKRKGTRWNNASKAIEMKCTAHNSEMKCTAHNKHVAAYTDNTRRR